LLPMVCPEHDSNNNSSEAQMDLMIFLEAI